MEVQPASFEWKHDGQIYKILDFFMIFSKIPRLFKGYFLK